MSTISFLPQTRIGLCSLTHYGSPGVLETAKGLGCRSGSLEADAWTLGCKMLIRDWYPGGEGSRIGQRRKLKRPQSTWWEGLA